LPETRQAHEGFRFCDCGRPGARNLDSARPGSGETIVLRFRRVIGVLLSSVTLITLVVGCGTNAGLVTGKVTYKGTPVPSATVSFLPASGEKVVAKPSITNSEGVYTVKDLAPGDYKVYITTPRKPVASTAPGAPVEVKELPAMPGKVSVEVPDKYSKADTSGLTYTVTKGKQTKDFALD